MFLDFLPSRLFLLRESPLSPTNRFTLDLHHTSSAAGGISCPSSSTTFVPHSKCTVATWVQATQNHAPYQSTRDRAVVQHLLTRSDDLAQITSVHTPGETEQRELLRKTGVSLSIRSCRDARSYFSQLQDVNSKLSSSEYQSLQNLNNSHSNIPASSFRCARPPSIRAAAITGYSDPTPPQPQVDLLSAEQFMSLHDKDKSVYLEKIKNSRNQLPTRVSARQFCLLSPQIQREYLRSMPKAEKKKVQAKVRQQTSRDRKELQRLPLHTGPKGASEAPPHTGLPPGDSTP